MPYFWEWGYLLDSIIEKVNAMASALDDLVTAEAAEDEKIDLLVVGYNNLKGVVADLTAQLEAAANDPKKIEALIERAQVEAAKIDATLNPPA